MGRSSGGGGRGGGNSGLPRLPRGFRYGSPLELSRNSFQVGDSIVNSRGASGGRVISVARTNLTLQTTYMGNPMQLKQPIAAYRGGFLQRGRTVFPLS